MTLDLSDDEKVALAAVLKQTIANTTAIRSHRDFAHSRRYWRDWNPREPLLSPIPHHPAAHRLVPVTTISTCRPPHLEQTNFSRQSSTDVSAPYRVAISAGS